MCIRVRAKFLRSNKLLIARGERDRSGWPGSLFQCTPPPQFTRFQDTDPNPASTQYGDLSLTTSSATYLEVFFGELARAPG